jgi:hypothetical protein
MDAPEIESNNRYFVGVALGQRNILISSKSFVGGARIGKMNATIPFARLVVSTGKLSLHCLRQYDLTPRQVSCESYGSIPLISWGIKFHHIDVDYPDPLIFWCISRRRVLEALQKAGFEVL